MNKVNYMYVLKLNKKLIITVILIVCILTVSLTIPVVAFATPNFKHIIVIDAGHGGIDGGSIGIISQVDERTLNLEYAKCLKSYFENFNFKVIMTRKNLEGLYGGFSANKKKDDMKARQKIINESNADLVISIHMNSFPLKSSKGAQVFYKKNDEGGKLLADKIQKQFIKDLPDARKSSQIGDYFILNCSSVISVIVECGFLSNPIEDKLLNSEAYKLSVCYAIFCGTVSFFGADNI